MPYNEAPGVDDLSASRRSYAVDIAGAAANAVLDIPALAGFYPMWVSVGRGTSGLAHLSMQLVDDPDDQWVQDIFRCGHMYHLRVKRIRKTSDTDATLIVVYD